METAKDSAIPTHLASSFSPVYGQSITIRPLRPEDLEIEAEFVRKLSPQSLYNRIFSAGTHISTERLQQLTRVDYSRDMALAATIMLDGREVEIGVARYVRMDDETSCEFAIVVADDWQRSGVGRMLMRRLIESASAAGLQCMFGDVLATNDVMLRFARKLGFTVTNSADGPTIRRVSLALHPPGPGATTTAPTTPERETAG